MRNQRGDDDSDDEEQLPVLTEHSFAEGNDNQELSLFPANSVDRPRVPVNDDPSWLDVSDGAYNNSDNSPSTTSSSRFPSNQVVVDGGYPREALAYTRVAAKRREDEKDVGTWVWPRVCEGWAAVVTAMREISILHCDGGALLDNGSNMSLDNVTY